jgi:hypothetical protein
MPKTNQSLHINNSRITIVLLEIPGLVFLSGKATNNQNRHDWLGWVQSRAGAFGAFIASGLVLAINP